MLDHVRRAGGWIVAASVVALVASCSGATGARRNQPRVTRPDDTALDAQGGEASGGATVAAAPPLESAHRIEGPETWARLAARPMSSAVARTEVVKFLVDPLTGRRSGSSTPSTGRSTTSSRAIVSRRQPIRSAARMPITTRSTSASTAGPSGASSSARSCIISTAIPGPSLVGGDTLSGDRILRLFEQVRGALWIGDRLRFRPMSPLHDQSIAPVRAQLPIATADEVFAGVRYQPLTEGPAFGTLRVVRGTLDPEHGAAGPDPGRRAPSRRDPRGERRD